MHGLIALLPMLFGIGGGWVGLATGVIQFDTALVNHGPAIVQGVKEIEQIKAAQCPCRRVVMRAGVIRKSRIEYKPRHHKAKSCSRK